MRLQKCEWCEDKASYRLVVPSKPDYVRYSCRDRGHKIKVRRLAELDTGTRPSESWRLDCSSEGFQIPDSSGEDKIRTRDPEGAE